MDLGKEMKAKTYLSRDRQVISTINLLIEEQDHLYINWKAHWNYKDTCFGFITKPHRLFLLNDLIIVYLWSNGQASRWPVLCVSSKGYTIKNFYLQRKSFWCKESDKPRNSYYDLIELPPYLANKTPDKADVRLYLIELLCVRDSAKTVDTGSRLKELSCEK